MKGKNPRFEAMCAEIVRGREVHRAGGCPWTFDKMFQADRVTEGEGNPEEYAARCAADDRGILTFYCCLEYATPEVRERAEAEIREGVAVDWSRWNW